MSLKYCLVHSKDLDDYLIIQQDKVVAYDVIGRYLERCTCENDYANYNPIKINHNNVTLDCDLIAF